MDTNLSGRMALITGSSSGLGKVIAKALAVEGASVIINGRQHNKVADTAYEIKRDCAHRIQAYQFVCDATDPKLRELLDAKLSKIGRLDILINNVGNIERFGTFEDLTEEDWQRSFDITFMSAVRFIKVSLPYLKKSRQARIINISSLSAHQPSFTGLNPHYGMAKAGIINLTKNLAADFGRYGILVNTICPSTLLGGGWKQNIKDRAKRERITTKQAEELMRKEEDRKSPLGKMGELSDVANLVVFLASSNANFLTGHFYNVDGGITRSIC
jgi:3-oxoacyl-[acyl-carrier protein] reductase